MLTAYPSRKAAKAFATRFGRRLAEDGQVLPFPLLLESLAFAHGHRDWNTFAANLPTPQSGLASPVASGVEGASGVSPDQEGVPFAFDGSVPWTNREAALVISANGGGAPAFLAHATRGFLAAGGAVPSRTMAIGVDPKGHNGVRWWAFGDRPPAMRQETSVGAGPGVFEVPTGLRRPLPMHRLALRRLLQSLFDLDAESETWKKPDVLELIIDVLYEETADDHPDGSPSYYESGILPEVDARVAGWPAANSNGPRTWWNVVDGLLERNELDLARMSAWQALPTFADLLGLARRREARGIMVFGDRAQLLRKALERLQDPLMVVMKRMPFLLQPTMEFHAETGVEIFLLGDALKRILPMMKGRAESVAFMAAYACLAGGLGQWSPLDREKDLPDHPAARRWPGTVTRNRIVFERIDAFLSFQVVRDAVIFTMENARRNRAEVIVQSETQLSRYLVQSAKHVFLLDDAMQFGQYTELAEEFKRGFPPSLLESLPTLLQPKAEDGGIPFVELHAATMSGERGVVPFR